MDKKVITLLSRYKLTHLFALISPFLKQNGYTVKHIAYSKVEAALLRNKYNIEPDYIFVDEIEKILKTNSLDMAIIEAIDKDYIKYSEGKFNLNSAMISDRGFISLTYTEALHLAQSYYIFWRNYIEQSNVFIIFHETTALLFNHICSILCEKNNIYYSGFIVSIGLTAKNFMFVEYDKGISLTLIANYAKCTKKNINENKIEITSFIKKIRSKTTAPADFKKEGFLKNLLYLIMYTLMIPANAIMLRQYDKLSQNIDYFLLKKRSYYPIKMISNRFQYSFLLSYDQATSGEKYYFYPLHIEPEAVLLYWAKGKYTNQIVLIEEIARSLPPNTYLYVKDHIVRYGYRDISDYRKIQSIPNVKLINPNMSAIELIHNSQGVISINGTAGFEGIVLKKNVFLLSEVYYMNYKNLYRINDVSELQKAFYAAQHQNINCDEDEIEKFVFAYIKAGHQGNIHQFFTKINPKDSTQPEIKKIAAGFIDYIEFLSKKH